MNRIILHIDFNSYFATVEQQANPRLRGKPIGVTGGDKDPVRTSAGDIIPRAPGTLPSPNGERRWNRTVLGAASVEAKLKGVKTGMPIMEALRVCPDLILVRGDSEKYLECTKRFLNILKDYSPFVEVFSIDEVFLEIPNNTLIHSCHPDPAKPEKGYRIISFSPSGARAQDDSYLLNIAQEIKQRIRCEVGDYITCSIGISYNKIVAKLAGSLYKPDGLVVIADEKAAIRILDQVELDEICGIGPRIKKRLNNMGIFNFYSLRKAPLKALLAAFKSYGQFLYDISRGINDSEVVPFYEKEEVKSIGHRHTISHDTNSKLEIQQLFLKLSELVARRLRAKKLLGKTVNMFFRYAQLRTSNPGLEAQIQTQKTTTYTNDGLEIFKTAWEVFLKIWQEEKIRMVGVSISNLKPELPSTLTLLEEDLREQKIIKTLDKINDRFGEFTLQRGILLQSAHIKRHANPFLADRRFKI